MNYIFLSELSINHRFRKHSRKEAFTSVRSSIHTSTMRRRSAILSNTVSSQVTSSRLTSTELSYTTDSTILSQPRQLTIPVELT